jgi:hypothetical protein
MADTTEPRRVEAEAILFGFPSTKAVLVVRPRSASWRATGAALTMGGSLVLAVVVAVVPPHAPWIIGALGGGAMLARRRWIERCTLESLQATCPKCGAALKVKAGRLRSPHPVPCEACHHQTAIRIDPTVLEGLGA